jgi:hypothetical protein
MQTNFPDPETGARPGVLDYSSVYGATFETLEAEWLESLPADRQ